MEHFDIQNLTFAHAAAKGKRVAYVPENAVSLWTTYEINPGEAWNLLMAGVGGQQPDVSRRL